MSIRSKRSQEGYLLIDNRHSPGISDDLLNTVGPKLPPGAGRGMFEAPTVTCSHCHTVVVVNPARTRERAYCVKCDHYICDRCGLVLKQLGVCQPFEKTIYDTQERA